MKKATPRHLQGLIKATATRSQYIRKEFLRLSKYDPALQEQYISERWSNADYVKGHIEGQNNMLEDLLHQSGCYKGFYYVDEDGNPVRTVESEKFCEYMREYIY